MIRRALVLALLSLSVVAPAASAHLLYMETGWAHEVHGRNLYFFNGASQQAWWDGCRAAQVNWDQTMGGSLHYDTVAHDSSALHCLDYNYGDNGYVGYAYGTCPHCLHAHLQMNSYYNYLVTGAGAKQFVACHEIGHPSGLAHSVDATDCMRSGSEYLTSFQYPTLSIAHRDQLRGQYNATGH